MKKRRAVIIGGARIRDYQKMTSILREDDYIIFCDSGLCHRAKLGMDADLVIGDFDSHPLPALRQKEPDEEYTEPAAYGQIIRHTRTEDGVELIVLPRMKDWTDTVYAAMETVKRGFTEVLLLGASGGRPDLYFGNISILNMLEMKGIDAWMVDDISGIRVIAGGRKPVKIADTCRYFSLLAYDGPARGIHVEGALYPLEAADMTAGDPYGVSNEVLPGRTAEVSLREGKMLLVVID